MLIKTVGITAAAAAIAIGAVTTGLVNVKALPGNIAQVFTVQQRHIIIGVDITAGRENEVPKDFRAVQRLLDNAEPGDKIEIYLIDSRSESSQEAIFSAELPEDEGPMGMALKKAKKGAQHSLSECWDKSINKVLGDNHLVQQTDLFGFFRFVSQKEEFRKSNGPVLILFTDGQQVGDGFNFEKTIPDKNDLMRAKQNEFIADLRNINVSLAGVTPTHAITNSHWRRLQAWWRGYLKEAGVDNISITSERCIEENSHKSL